MGLAPQDCLNEIVLYSTAAATNLLSFASSRAFKTLNVNYMRKLAGELRVRLPSPRPVTELQSCLFLMQTQEPLVSKEELKRRFEKFRCRKVSDEVWASLITEAEADNLDKVVDKDAAKEAKERGEAQKAAAQRRAARTKAEAKGKAQSGGTITKDTAHLSASRTEQASSRQAGKGSITPIRCLRTAAHGCGRKHSQG